MKYVRLTGLEPARRETLDPKSSASTNSATGAVICSLRMQRYNVFTDSANYCIKSLRAYSMMVSSPFRKSSLVSCTE